MNDYLTYQKHTRYTHFIIKACFYFIIISVFLISFLIYQKAKFLGISFFILISLIFTYAYFIEPYNLKVSEHKINFNFYFSQIKIIHISDLHLGAFLKEKWIKEVIHKINQLQADFIFITGDLMDRRKQVEIDRYISILGLLRAKSGIYAVLGNHDQSKEIKELLNSLEKIKIKVLINESEKISLNGFHFWILGVNDPYIGRDNLKLALEGIPEDNFKLLLSHSPDILRRIESKKINLILAGHTHGGQVRLPFFKTLIPFSTYKEINYYSSGLFKIKDSWIYVNRGLGMDNLPFRFLSSPEITVLKISGKKLE
ncbi:MAG: metallophosphoesterase [Armatimonadetes bacterium]|nr:metallophosphoesterase [Armatimonadota bacterium]